MKKTALIIAIMTAGAIVLASPSRASGPPTLGSSDCQTWLHFSADSISYSKDETPPAEFSEDHEKDMADMQKLSYIFGLIDSANNIADYLVKSGEKDIAERIRLNHNFFEYMKTLDAICARDPYSETTIAELIYDVEILLNEEKKKEK